MITDSGIMGDSSLVYSTESGTTCPECEKSIDECSCNPSANARDGLKTVRVSSTNKREKREDSHTYRGTQDETK